MLLQWVWQLFGMVLFEVVVIFWRFLFCVGLFYASVVLFSFVEYCFLSIVSMELV